MRERRPKSNFVAAEFKIVSGGQTGADRAALDWAIEKDILHGGWCPKGRLAEDGIIHSRYLLQETPSENLDQRTEWNVRDSDGTAIFCLQLPPTGGSAFTKKCCRGLRKPCVVLSRQETPSVCTEKLSEFIRRHCIRVLNVAGPRVSKEPEVGSFVQEVLTEIFQ